MELIEEKETPKSYSAVYDCGKNMLKVVSVYLSHDETAFLEIQQTGLELKIRRLEFEHGKVTGHHVSGRRCGKMQSPADSPAELDRLLTEYTTEFVDIIMDSDKLMRYMKSHFTQLQDYIAKSVAFSRRSTEKMKIPELPPELPEKPGQES